MSGALHVFAGKVYSRVIMKSVAALIAAVMLMIGTAAAQPCAGRLEPEKKKSPKPLPSTAAGGAIITYWIVGLGDPNATACSAYDGHRVQLTNTIRARQAGEGRTFQWWESFFDRYTDNRWNWTGSAKSGGRDWKVAGAIGDLRVRCENRFDCAAKNHDLKAWLAANFAEGAAVRLGSTPNGRYDVYRVESGLDVHTEVYHLFHDAAVLTLRNDRRIAVREGDSRLLFRIDTLAERLRFTTPTATGEVIYAIFNDAKLKRGIPEL
jgi:hypothetical protein